MPKRMFSYPHTVRRPTKVPEKVKAYVKKAVKKSKEKGFSDTANTEEPATDTSVFIPLNDNLSDAIDVGQENAAEGLTMQMTYLEGRFVSTNTAATAHSIRNYILYDRRPDGALPAVTDFLESNSSASLVTAQNISDNRFTILYDRSYVLGGNTNASKEDEIQIHKVKINLRKLPLTKYITSGASGAIGSMIQGSLIWLSCGDATAAGQTVAVRSDLRLHYEL